MELSYRDIFLKGTEEVRCGQSRGKVLPFNGYKLPELLKIPSIQKSEGTIRAYESGGRSSIIHDHKKWFKKKGDKPVNGRKWGSGEPFGGMSRKNATNELEASEKIDSMYQEFGYWAAISPVAFVEYDIPFENGENVCSSVMEIRGDTRVNNLNARLMKANREGLLYDRKIRDELSDGLAYWIGFANRVLEEKSLFPTPISSNLNNYCLYRVKEGFGVSRIDLGSASSNPDKASLDTTFMELVAVNLPFAVITEGRSKSEAKPLLRRYELHQLAITSREVALDSENVLFDELGKAEEERLEPKLPVLKVPKKVVDDFMEPLQTKYNKAFEGDVTPEPIDRKLVYRVFDSVKISSRPPDLRRILKKLPPNAASILYSN